MDCDPIPRTTCSGGLGHIWPHIFCKHYCVLIHLNTSGLHSIETALFKNLMHGDPGECSLLLLDLSVAFDTPYTQNNIIIDSLCQWGDRQPCSAAPSYVWTFQGSFLGPLICFVQVFLWALKEYWSYILPLPCRWCPNTRLNCQLWQWFILHCCVSAIEIFLTDSSKA